MAAKILFVTLAVAMAFVLGSVTRAQNPAPLAMVPVFYADGSAVAGVHIVIGRISIGEGPPHPVKLPRPPLEEFPLSAMPTRITVFLPSPTVLDKAASSAAWMADNLSTAGCGRAGVATGLLVHR
jgi:hypothetical protein